MPTIRQHKAPFNHNTHMRIQHRLPMMRLIRLLLPAQSVMTPHTPSLPNNPPQVNLLRLMVNPILDTPNLIQAGTGTANTPHTLFRPLHSLQNPRNINSPKDGQIRRNLRLLTYLQKFEHLHHPLPRLSLVAMSVLQGRWTRCRKQGRYVRRRSQR